MTMRHPLRKSFSFTPRTLAFLLVATGLTACANPETALKKVELPAPKTVRLQTIKPAPDVMQLKRKIAIGRFTNETRYGRTFLRDGSTDPLGKQASDMLASRLVQSGQFLVFERSDLNKIKAEQTITGQNDLIGVNTLIFGAITEFGRETVGQSGFLSSTLKQVVHAKVEIRLADPKTGYVFFSAAGQGEASSEASNTMGFGSRADYDASLNDKAIGAAVSEVMNSLVTKLKEKPWRTDILKMTKSRVFTSGGKRQGLKIGDKLAVMREGEKIKSKQTGFTITLPASQIATLGVVSLFGTTESDEGAESRYVTGSLPRNQKNLFVTELKEAP